MIASTCCQPAYLSSRWHCHICKGYWPLNTQLVSYCLLVVQQQENKRRLTNEKGRLLEILTGEGKSCVIAMVAATYALLGRTVDIVTSSPVLSGRDAEEWRSFYSSMKLKVICNVEDNTTEDTTYYECPIVYGTVETFARDILKTEFLLHDVRNGRKCDIVIVDEVDSMLIDQGVQCTYLSHDVASIGMRHFEPIFSLVWMNVNTFWKYQDDDGMVWYGTEPKVFLATLSRISKSIDPLKMLHLAEDDEKSGIKKGFTDEYLSKDIEGQKRFLRPLTVLGLAKFFTFALKYLKLDFKIMESLSVDGLGSKRIRLHSTQNEEVDIVVYCNGLSSILFKEDLLKVRLKEMITHAISDNNEIKIDLPDYLRDYCNNRLMCWIDNAFTAYNMQLKREYIVQDNVIYPVDYKSTGVIETNKKWGDGLQQFLEMKHGLPRSPLSLITNFLSNIDFFERYGSNIIGVSGTLGNDAEKKFMSETFSVKFATIPTSKRRKLIELDGMILNNEDKWLNAVYNKVESVKSSGRAVLVICEDIANAHEIKTFMEKLKLKPTLYSHSKEDDNDKVCIKKVLEPGNVIITTNLGARGTDFVTDDHINKNGGLFVLVTFIPLNDRVEKQAFGRTGRRGATGSCQVIVNREAMTEWARQCKTVDEAKRVRDYIEMRRLNNMTEVNSMRSKQRLFREYCEIKNDFFKSSHSEPDDIKIQLELLDETWAKWIQYVETRSQELNNEYLIQELGRNIEVCSDQAKHFVSDNIYNILKFGEVRLMKGDFEGASRFYGRVIDMDPAWSAFAHYNRAYCTIQMKGDGYIAHAISDLKATLCRFQAYKKNTLFSDICIKLSERYAASRRARSNMPGSDPANSKATLDFVMTECQLLHHIDTQIFETIGKLVIIDTMQGEVTTVRRNILDLIPGADCRTEQMLQEYRQLGLLFTYNIDEGPTCCCMNQNVSSRVVVLESVAVELLTNSSELSLKSDSLELKNTIDALCNIGTIGDHSLGWMSRCVTEATVTGIRSINFIRDVSSLVPIKQIELESSFKMLAKPFQFEQFANSQAVSTLLAQALKEVNELLIGINKTILTDKVVMGHLEKKIQERINKLMAPGQKLHRSLCFLHGSVASASRFDRQLFVNYFNDLVQLSVCSSQFSDIQTAELQNLAVELVSMSRSNTETTTSMITSAVKGIESIITNFTDWLDKITQKTTVHQYSCADEEMHEAANNVLTSAWSDIIFSVVQRRISQSLMHDSQDKLTRMLYETIGVRLSFTSKHVKKKLMVGSTRKIPPPLSSDASNRMTKLCKNREKTRDHQSVTEARLISEDYKRKIQILGIDDKLIRKLSFLGNVESIKLIYHAYEGGKLVDSDDDYNLLSVIGTVMRKASTSSLKRFINLYCREYFGELFAKAHCASQLKRGRALLRLEMKHPTRQLNQSEYVELDSSHLFSCLELASKSENVNQLAKVLAEYDSQSRSAEKNSSEHGAEMMASSVSRDACKLFLSSGNSFEADVYRQLVVERINDGDITTALKLCCIGHQTVFSRYNSNLPISDGQTVKDTFDLILKVESYEQERSKFMSICDEWCRVLEPRGLMNKEQRKLLREWISTRQYANTEDPVVSLVIEKCLKSRIGKERRERAQAIKEAKIKKKAMKQRRIENKMRKAMKDKEVEKKQRGSDDKDQRHFEDVGKKMNKPEGEEKGSGKGRARGRGGGRGGGRGRGGRRGRGSGRGGSLCDV